MDHSTTVATPVAAQPKKSAFTRVVATALTAALAAGGLTVLAVAAPASAAVTDSVSDATLTWGLQNTAANWGVETAGDVELVSPTVATDYTKATAFTLTDGAGTISPDGTGTLDFDGSVTYSPFAAYGTMTFHSTFTLADFQLKVTSATRGELTADVTWVKEASSKTEPTRVTVANFDISSMSVEDGEFALQTAAPDWANTVEAGKYNGTYTDAWPTSLVDALLPLASASDIPVYFYRTGNTAGNTNKAPLAFSAAATVATPSVTPTFVSATPTGGYVFTAAGDGFRQVTNPGDAGIYAAVAPAGGAPGYGTDSMGSYIGTKYIFANGSEGPSTSKLTDGAFSTTITLPTASLDPDVEYSLYTWQSHTHSNTTQDTETPLDIDFADLAPVDGTVELALAKPSLIYGTSVAASATVAGATGDVTFSVDGTEIGTAALVEGVASVDVPTTLAVGTRVVTASYTGNGDINAAVSAPADLRVKKATASKVTIAGSKYKKNTAPVVTVKVGPLNNGAWASGTVKVYVGSKVVKTVSLYKSSKGVLTITLPKSTSTSSSIKVKASYGGSDTINSGTSSTVTIKRK